MNDTPAAVDCPICAGAVPVPSPLRVQAIPGGVLQAVSCDTCQTSLRLLWTVDRRHVLEVTADVGED